MGSAWKEEEELITLRLIDANVYTTDFLSMSSCLGNRRYNARNVL